MYIKLCIAVCPFLSDVYKALYSQYARQCADVCVCLCVCACVCVCVCVCVCARACIVSADKILCFITTATNNNNNNKACNAPNPIGTGQFKARWRYGVGEGKLKELLVENNMRAQRVCSRSENSVRLYKSDQQRNKDKLTYYTGPEEGGGNK